MTCERSPGLGGAGLALAVLVAVFGISSAQGPALADTGYRIDYDYQGQGDDWYGSGLPDIRYDYADTTTEFFDGDDFGVGYEANLDLLGQGPPLARTNLQRFEYRFRFDAASDCRNSSDCSDGLFCNGAEVCGFDSFCESGAAPTCDDADPCTSDSCSNTLGSCVFDPVPPPPPASGLMLVISDPALDVATLSWSAVAEADAYNVYRGEDTQLSDLSCLYDDVAGTSVDDDGTLPPGGLYVHLVSARACSESSLGEDSAGNERPNDSPCP